MLTILEKELSNSCLCIYGDNYCVNVIEKK